MKLTIQYHTEKPAVDLDVTETAPGLCIGPNPAHADYINRPKFAVFHTPSASIIKAVKTKAGARELAARLAPLLDWNRPLESLTWEELAPARKIARDFPEDCKGLFRVNLHAELLRDDPAYRARLKRQDAERQAAWDKTPRKLFGNDDDSHARAEAAGWKFERDTQGYNGNPPAFYAISPTGYRFRWNGSMMHGGADPWEPVGPVVTPA